MAFELPEETTAQPHGKSPELKLASLSQELTSLLRQKGWLPEFQEVTFSIGQRLVRHDNLHGASKLVAIEEDITARMRKDCVIPLKRECYLKINVRRTKKNALPSRRSAEEVLTERLGSPAKLSASQWASMLAKVSNHKDLHGLLELLYVNENKPLSRKQLRANDKINYHSISRFSNAFRRFAKKYEWPYRLTGHNGVHLVHPPEKKAKAK